MEIANTLKIFSAYRILKCKLFSNTEKILDCKLIGVTQRQDPLGHYLESINDFCLTYGLNISSLEIYPRMKFGNIVYTSEIYRRQKTRENNYVYWNDSFFGVIIYFINLANKMFAVIRELLPVSHGRKEIICEINKINFYPT